MYVVTINNGIAPVEIHGNKHKLARGNVVQGINTIDSFSMTVLPSNPAFNNLRDFKTLVEVYNTNKRRYEFQGRVLYSSDGMDEKGLITQEATCESFLGYLCDSMQLYVAERNWAPLELLERIVNVHNSQTEEHKHFYIGEVDVTDPNNNLYCGIQRENSFDTIKKKLIDVLGGEIRFRVVGGKLYLDYLKKIGELRTTPIALARNMKSITRERDPSSFVTRLIPLGCKLKGADAEGNEVETEERLDISEVNDGKNYIDDEQAIERYGVHVGVMEWDDVTERGTLFTKGKAWLEENNKVLIKYQITVLDLALLGLDADTFDVYNYHPVEHALLGIDDTTRIIKKNLDVCEEVKSTIEFGENFKSLSDLQIEQKAKLEEAANTVAVIGANYVTNEKLTSEITKTTSLITQSSGEILLQVAREYVSQTGFETYKEEQAAELSLKIGKDENDQIVSMLNASAEVITINSNRLTINSTNFELTADGTISAKTGKIGGWTFGAYQNGAGSYLYSAEGLDADLMTSRKSGEFYVGNYGLRFVMDEDQGAQMRYTLYSGRFLVEDVKRGYSTSLYGNEIVLTNGVNDATIGYGAGGYIAISKLDVSTLEVGTINMSGQQSAPGKLTNVGTIAGRVDKSSATELAGYQAWFYSMTDRGFFISRYPDLDTANIDNAIAGSGFALVFGTGQTLEMYVNGNKVD